MVSKFASAQYDSFEQFTKHHFGFTLGYDSEGKSLRKVTQREFNIAFKKALVEVHASLLCSYGSHPCIL